MSHQLTRKTDCQIKMVQFMFRRNRHKLAWHLLCYCNTCIWFQNILQQQVICCFGRMHFMIWVSTTYVCYRLLWGIVWLTISAWIWEPQLLRHQLKRSSKCTAKPALHSLSLISATKQHNDESLSVFFNFCCDSGYNPTLSRQYTFLFFGGFWLRQHNTTMAFSALQSWRVLGRKVEVFL